MGHKAWIAINVATIALFDNCCGADVGFLKNLRSTEGYAVQSDHMLAQYAREIREIAHILRARQRYHRK